MVRACDDLVSDVRREQMVRRWFCIPLEASWICVPGHESVLYVYVPSLGLCIGLTGLEFR